MPPWASAISAGSSSTCRSAARLPSAVNDTLGPPGRSLAVGRSGAEWPALTLFQVGADEGAVHSLLDDRLAGKRFRFGLELERGCTAAEEPVWRGALVAHMDEGRARGAPGRQQFADTLLGIWIVALFPRWIVEGALYVDHEQGRKRHSLHADRFLWVFDASHRRSPSRSGRRGESCR